MTNISGTLAAPGTAAIFHPQLNKDVLSIIQEYIVMQIDLAFLNVVLSHFCPVNPNHLYGAPQHNVKELAIYKERGFEIKCEKDFHTMIKTYVINADVDIFIIRRHGTIHGRTKENIGGVTVINESPSVRFAVEDGLRASNFLHALDVWRRAMRSIETGCRYSADFEGVHISDIKHIIDEGRSVLVLYIDFTLEDD